jgi:hypothetical protein
MVTPAIFREHDMRIRRRFASTVAGLVAVAVLSACGGSSTSSVISGKSPAQILAQALSKANGQQFDFSSVTSFSADTSKVTGFSPSQLGTFGPILANGFTVKIDGTYESATRTMVHISLTAPICSSDLYETDYDGESYVSADGVAWADVGPTSSSTSLGGITSQAKLADSLTGIGFKDNGSTSQDQQDVEDLRLDLNNQMVQKIASATGQQSLATGFSAVGTVNGDGVDIYVLPSNGLLESVKGTLNVTLNVDSLVQLISLAGAAASLGDLGGAGGKLGISVNEDLEFTDWGSATVTKPSPTQGTTLPDFCPELGNLGPLGGLIGGDSSSVPTPDLSGNFAN